MVLIDFERVQFGQFNQFDQFGQFSQSGQFDQSVVSSFLLFLFIAFHGENKQLLARLFEAFPEQTMDFFDKFEFVFQDISVLQLVYKSIRLLYSSHGSFLMALVTRPLPESTVGRLIYRAIAMLDYQGSNLETLLSLVSEEQRQAIVPYLLDVDWNVLDGQQRALVWDRNRRIFQNFFQMPLPRTASYLQP